MALSGGGTGPGPGSGSGSGLLDLGGPARMRILQRPERPSLAAHAPGPRPLRSLQQRQQDYEAARLRILGEATPSVPAKADPSRPPNQNKPKEKPADDNNAPYIMSDNIVAVQPRVPNQPASAVSLLRAPRGPDDSKGFNLRR